MTATFMNAFYEPFAHAQKKPWVVPTLPLVECIAYCLTSNFPIREMLRLGRDTIMYPPVRIPPGVVDQRWIGTLKAGQGV